MRIFVAIFTLIGAFWLASCSAPNVYTGPEVTRILVYKSSRMLYLMHGNAALKAYPINLGFAPEGDKAYEGDGKTPEGNYYIDRKNPNSDFHLSLGISYPDAHHRAAAREAGLAPGGDIFVHGGPTDPRYADTPDWTAGCMAVSDAEIEEIYWMVKVGTPISIYP
jgi:murein L,D-transpeptidase YafK